jgi:glycosyltransferase involved in cell wall biosynthesis
VADRVTVASRELSTLVGAIGVPSDRITYLPNATWPGAAGWPKGDGGHARDRLGLGDAPVLLLYSRLFEFNLDRLLDAVATVVAALPRARLLVVGAGLRGEDARLRSGLASRSLDQRTVLVGWVERAELPDLLAAADVALVPMDDTRVNRARCSVKLLDLMLAGRAIVADAVGQANEYLRDDSTGRLIKTGRAEDMADAALALLKRPSTARRLGRAAERAARHELTWAAQQASLRAAIVDR